MIPQLRFPMVAFGSAEIGVVEGAAAQRHIVDVVGREALRDIVEQSGGAHVLRERTQRLPAARDGFGSAP